MAKIYPQTPTSSPSSSSSSSSSIYITTELERFTIWMKSLVFHGHGCTVFDSNGEIVYRMDNYDKKCCREVYLMDVRGNVLFSIRQKRLRIFGRWDGYKWGGACRSEKQPWFQVRKHGRIFRRDMTCHVTLGGIKTYQFVKTPGKLGFKIVDREDTLVAEVKQKESSSGVVFGDDVLSLMVEPQIDHSLIMAFVMVHGLMNNKL